MRAQSINRLSVKGVSALKDSGMHADGGGLYLNITKTGAKSWRFVYRLHGRRREKGLGSLTSVGLADARAKAAEMRALIADGKDPLAQRAKPDGALTFGEAANALIASLELGWKNEKHRAQWRSTLETYCTRIWSQPVASIETTDVREVLWPIWMDKRETASRLRGRIERVMDWAKVHGHREGENPARWSGHLELIMPKRKRFENTTHHAAMPFAQVPAFVAGLRKRHAMGARALEFLIHTAARTGEVLAMTWSEVDREAKTWTVPASRMKMGRAHTVPLTDAAMELIDAMAVFGVEPDKPVFPGRSGQPLSNMTMASLLRRMEVDEFTVHGFRSSFRDWAGETTDVPREVAEAALAHVVGNAVEQAYRRGTALAKRRDLMNAWSAYITS